MIIYQFDNLLEGLTQENIELYSQVRFITTSFIAPTQYDKDIHRLRPKRSNAGFTVLILRELQECISLFSSKPQ